MIAVGSVNMRKQLVITIEDVLAKDDKLILLLGDIGVFGFRNAFALYPDRVLNIGILEQATVSLAAGLALCGFIPVFHTIAPFLVERALEQLKDDFGYQKLGGNFITIGASYDYAAFGCTHHCPGDVGILQNIPNMEIIVPGTADEFDKLFKQAYSDGKPTYYRLSERSNSTSHNVKFGKAKVIKEGKQATIVAVGPTLDVALKAAKNFDVTVLYYTTVIPFDQETLKKNCPSQKVLLCEPYYEGGVAWEISQALLPKSVKLETIGVPHEFLRNYGHMEEQDEFIGLTVQNITLKLKKLISDKII